MPDAIIFDVDGTLVNSNAFHVAAWDRAFRRFGKTFSSNQLHQQIGKGADQYLPAFLNPEELRAFGGEVDRCHSEIYQNEYLPLVRPFPGVRQLFERIKCDHQRIALATSGKQQELRVYTRIARIDDLVDAAVTAEDVDRSKPAPDLFKKALEKLGNPLADKVIVVGDTPYDAEAARKIGVTAIGLLCGGFRKRQLQDAGVAGVYRDPEDLLEHYNQSPLASPAGVPRQVRARKRTGSSDGS